MINAWIIAPKIKFYIKNFFIKCCQIHSFLSIWSHLLRESLVQNFTFCTVTVNPFMHNVEKWPLTFEVENLLLNILFSVIVVLKKA